MTAPIVLFVYNRPEHTRKTVEALSANMLANESDLFIYSDAAKNDTVTERVNAVRSYIKTVSGFKSVTIIERDRNWRLAPSIIDGVTNVVNQYGKVIVLEDDIVTSPWFLTYMNDALTLYENNERVICIHGYVYPVKKKLPDYFFIRGANCWGWATWKRGWDIFNPDAEFLLMEIEKQKLKRDFNFNNSYDFTGMLRDTIDGKISSWAVRWHASAFLSDKYTLYPGISFIKNIGLDGSGTHCKEIDADKTEMISTVYKPISLPLIELTASNEAKKAFVQYFRFMCKKSIITKFLELFSLKKS
jgi:hypothetical protein